MDNAEIGKALFAALAANDADGVRALCSPQMRVRQNNGPVMSLDALLHFNAAVHAVVQDFQYTQAMRAATPGGFVEEHLVYGRLPAGDALNLMACVVADVRDGKVIEVREYFDTAAAAGLIAALKLQR
jgi:uncharacterized protein